MAVTPPTGAGGLGAQAAPTFRGIPFWDPGAFPPQTVTGIDPNTGTQTIAQPSAPGIITLLPENPNDPWPDSLSIWDTVFFNGIRAPGVAEVLGGRRRRIDLRVTPGASGATASNMGYDPGEFSVSLTLWTAKQWAAWKQLAGMLSPPPTAKVQPKAVKIWHPALQSISLTDCFVESIELPRRGTVPGTIVIQIDCLEYLPQLNEGGGQLGTAGEWNYDPATGTYQAASRTVPADPSTTSTGP